jgi:predicted AlkP superfamily phosphohydrolase/phosphomutase
VRRVLKVPDLYTGPRLASLPDLLVEWSREAPIRRVTSAKTGLVTGVDPQRRSGDHRPEGIFFTTGPGLGGGPLAERVSIIDFAPTIASLLSVPFPGAEGKPIREVAGAAASAGEDRLARMATPGHRRP